MLCRFVTDRKEPYPMLKLTLYGPFRAEDSNGREIPIKSKKARALLAYLARPAGTPRSRDQLAALLWSDRGDEQAKGSLRQALSALRKELGEGFAEVLVADDEFVQLDAGRVNVAPARAGDEFLAGLSITDSAFDEWLRDERLRDESVHPVIDEGVEVNTSSTRPSIAVLPFENVSGDPEQEYFVVGITEDIITELSRFNSLSVISPASSFHYKGLSPAALDVGHDLNVEFVVEGSVRRSGNRIRVSAQLVDARNGRHLWAERYDRELEDIFAVQDEVVSNIVMMIPGRVEIERRKNSERKPTEDIGAYDLLLQAEWLFFGNYSSPDGIRLLEKVIEIDPKFAVAHARLAIHTSYGIFSRCLDIQETQSLVRHHSGTATMLAPDDALVHGLISEAYAMTGEHEPARYHAEKAMSLNPNAFYVMAAVAEAKACLGEFGESCALIERAMQNDPYSALGFRETKVDAYYMAKRYEDATQQLIGWPNPPPHTELAVALALAQLGRRNEAKAMIKRITELVPKKDYLVTMCRAYQNMCAREEDKEHWLDGFRKAGVSV